MSPQAAALPLFAVLLALAAVVPFPPAPAISLRAAAQAGALEVSTPHYGGAVTLVVSRDTMQFDDIAYYWDERYVHGRGASARFAHGILNHLDDALLERGYHAQTRLVDADELETLLEISPAKTCLLLLDGVLPDTVRDPSRDLLYDWLSRGGTVIFAGEPFDAVYASPGRWPAVDFTRRPEFYGGQHPALEPEKNWSSPDLAFADDEAKAWPIARIPFVRTTFGVRPERLEHGSAIGYVDTQGRSSMTVFGIGRGHVVLFADGIDDESRAADYVAQLLATHLFAGTASVRAQAVRPGAQSQTVELGAGARTVAAYGRGAHYAPFASLTPEVEASP